MKQLSGILGLMVVGFLAGMWHPTTANAQLIAVPPTITWSLNGTVVTNTNCLYSPSDPQWDIAGKADLNGDGVEDLVLIHRNTQQVAVWYLVSTGTCITVGSSAILSGATLQQLTYPDKWRLLIHTYPLIQFEWWVE